MIRNRLSREPLLMDVKAASLLLGIRPRRLYELAARGVLPSGIVIRLGRSVRINRIALMRWLGEERDPSVR